MSTPGIEEIYNYWIYIVLMMIGFYGVIAKTNLIKKVLSLGLFQTGIFLFYISMAYVTGGAAPIWDFAHGAPGAHGETGAAARDTLFVNPVPHVLILTAIVVSVSTTAVALSVVVGIQRAYGTVESDELEELERSS